MAELDRQQRARRWHERIERDAGTVAPLRRAELERFLELGFPGRSDERWKYTRTARLAEFADRWLSADGTAGADARGAAGTDAPAVDGCRLWLVDGVLDAERSDEIPAGIELASELIGSDALVGQPATAMRALNGALAAAPLNLIVAPGAKIDEPILVIHTLSGAERALACPRIVLDVGDGARLYVLEYFAPAPGETMTNALTAMRIGPAAQITHYRIQQHGDKGLHVGELAAQLAQGGSLRSFGLDTGGGLVRNEYTIRLSGSGARAELHGVYATGGEQHVDNRLQVEHCASDTHSLQDFAGAAGARSRVVFNGRVHVHAGADGTDARQSNRNLLLGDQAEIDTKPELEIYADDVKCSHGATVGQLDEAALFYLRSRGLDRRSSRMLLTKAFASDCIRGIDSDAIRSEFADRMAARFDALLHEADL